MWVLASVSRLREQKRGFRCLPSPPAEAVFTERQVYSHGAGKGRFHSLPGMGCSVSEEVLGSGSSEASVALRTSPSPVFLFAFRLGWAQKWLSSNLSCLG